MGEEVKEDRPITRKEEKRRIQRWREKITKKKKLEGPISFEGMEEEIRRTGEFRGMKASTHTDPITGTTTFKIEGPVRSKKGEKPKEGK